MCGGAEVDRERARPLFEIMGEKIVTCGEAGQGQAVKVISQAITAVNCATLAQGLVLARQVGTCTLQWVANSLELLERLCADWERLRQLFSPAGDPGPLTRLGSEAGDRHRDGQSVTDDRGRPRA